MRRMPSLAREAEQWPKLDANRAARQRGEKPHPAMQRAGCDAADEGADVAAEPKPGPHPINRPPTAAASNDLIGGQGLRANGAEAAAAAMAPRIMPTSVRLEVSLRIEPPS